MDFLNNLTNKLNSFADKMTKSGEQNFSGQNVGLGGLGNVYSTHENGVMESLVNTAVDEDSRQITAYINRFENNEEYTEYFRNWFINTGLFSNVSMLANNCIGLQLQTMINNQPFGANYRVFVCRTQDDADAAFKMITSNGQICRQNEPTILIGYINFNFEQQNLAKNTGVQLVDISGIQEINSAIELAFGKIPYVTFEKTLFVHVLANAIHNKYKAANNALNQGMVAPVVNTAETTVNVIPAVSNTESTFSNVTNSINDKIDSLSGKAAEVLNDTAEVYNGGLPIQMSVPQPEVSEEQPEVSEEQPVKTSGVILSKNTTSVESSGLSLSKKSGVSLLK